MLGRIGRWTMGVSGVALISSLPVTRSAMAQDLPPEPPAPEAPDPQFISFDGKDPAECEYWRWCNMDGTSCAACNGGGVTTCAPGSKPGASSGSLLHQPRHRKDLSDRLLRLLWCTVVLQCVLRGTRHAGDHVQPGLRSYDQEIIWCVSDESQSYTCTMAPIIGEDCQTRPAARPRVGAGA